MLLTSGTQVGPYQITTLIGKGGMGEVYRARDTSLKRDVALKVLPSALNNDHDRIARFRREAEVLAQLDHPNIAPRHCQLEATRNIRHGGVGRFQVISTRCYCPPQRKRS